MAEKLCTLRTKGGGSGAKQTETVLWTNSAPTSSFAAQTVTLSDDINNYDYIAVTYYCSPSLTQGARAIRSVADFKKGVYNTKNVPEMCLSYMDGSSTPNPMFRPVLYASDTTVRFYDCVTKGSSTVYNGYLQPLSIIGIKNIGGTSIKSQFKEIFICSSPGSSSDALASRGYELENAQSGDTLTGEGYNMTYLTASYTSGSTGYCQVTAKSDITAMVIKGYNTATYTVQNYTTGQLVGQCNRRSNDFLIIGVL